MITPPETMLGIDGCGEGAALILFAASTFGGAVEYTVSFAFVWF